MTIPTLYAFIIHLATLVGLIILLALGDVASSVALPLIVGLAGIGVGVAIPNTLTKDDTK